MFRKFVHPCFSIHRKGNSDISAAGDAGIVTYRTGEAVTSQYCTCWMCNTCSEGITRISIGGGYDCKIWPVNLGTDQELTRIKADSHIA